MTTEPYLQIKQSFLFTRLLEPSQFRVALALLGHVDPFDPLASIGVSLSTLAGRANVSKTTLCEALQALETRCAKCFAVLGACSCRSKKPMVQRLSSKGGHSTTRYKIHFAIAALQPIGQKPELSENRTAPVRFPDSGSQDSEQPLSGNRTHLEIERSEEDQDKIPLPPSGSGEEGRKASATKIKNKSPRTKASPFLETKTARKTKKSAAAEAEPVLPSPSEMPTLLPPPAKPWQLVVKLYHELLPELSPAEVMVGSKTDIDLRDRWAEHPTEDFWRGYFGRVAKSPWLMGRERASTWSASLPWLLQPGNLSNVLAGKYPAREVKHGDWRDNQPRQNTAMASGPEPGPNLLSYWSMTYLDAHPGEEFRSKGEREYVRRMTEVWKARGARQEDDDFTLDDAPSAL